MARLTTPFAFAFTRSQVRRERPLAVVLPTVEPSLDDAEAPLGGPGWFDSSWDLQHGLEVREGLPGDAQLNEWIEACLRSAPAAAPLAAFGTGTLALA